MNEIESYDDGSRIFDFDGKAVRMVWIEGVPWFVASDACKILGIANVGNALARLDQVDIRSADVQNARGQMRKTKVVSEPGLYDLISGSEKPAAKQFRRWIFEQTVNR